MCTQENKRYSAEGAPNLFSLFYPYISSVIGKAQTVYDIKGVTSKGKDVYPSDGQILL